MAVPESELDTRTREIAKKKEKMDKLKEKRALLEYQEVNLAKALAGNNKKLRDKALKGLKKWIENRSQVMSFNEEDFMRIWKGLFYAMWMSDKPLTQETCAESIAHLVHLPKISDALLFYKCSMKTLINEWFGIDQLRLDKFLMLLRRLLRQALYLLKNNHWEKKYIGKFSNILTETILSTEKVPPLGLSMHFIDIFLEELAKVSEGNIEEHVVSSFIKPFVQHIALVADGRQMDHIRQHIFHHLMKQSELGLEYEEKYRAWKMQGFPGGSIKAMQKQEIPEDELMSDEDEQEIRDDENQELDPRAGHVDVLLPQLKFSSRQIVHLLEQYRFHPGSSTKSRKAVAKLISDFQEMVRGIYPLGIKKITLPATIKQTINIRKSVNELFKFEKKLMGKSNKRKRKLSLDDADIKKVKLTNGLNYEKRTPKQKQNSFDNQPASTTKKNPEKHLFENFDFKFRRNSGTWFVSNSNETLLTPSKSTPVTENFVKKPLNVDSETPDFSSSAKNMKRKKNQEKATSTPKQVLFPQSEWDDPLKDGEVEYFIPSKKQKKELVMKTPTIVANPFASKSPKTNSSKKVNINLKLNKSQEIHEHHAQLKSSPGIPFDANKKPTKPLLKSKINSPINPFHKLFLNV